MLVGTENTSDQFIITLAVDVDIEFVIFMNMVDIHLKVEYFKQEKSLMKSSSMELTLYNLL